MLFERGHNVVIPRLPHHGYADRLTTALARLTVPELEACGLEALERARRLGDDGTVVGFSAGGTIAACLAQRQPVDRVHLIAPFLGSRWIARPMTPAVARAFDLMPNRFFWWDPIRRERLGPEHGYPRYPTHAVVRAYQLAAAILREAATQPPASARVTVVINPADTTCNNRAIEDLYVAWLRRAPDRARLVRLTGLPRSHDIIEPERRVDPARRVYPRLLEIIDA